MLGLMRQGKPLSPVGQLRYTGPTRRAAAYLNQLGFDIADGGVGVGVVVGVANGGWDWGSGDEPMFKAFVQEARA